MADDPKFYVQEEPKTPDHAKGMFRTSIKVTLVVLAIAVLIRAFVELTIAYPHFNKAAVRIMATTIVGVVLIGFIYHKKRRS